MTHSSASTGDGCWEPDQSQQLLADMVDFKSVLNTMSPIKRQRYLPENLTSAWIEF
jgi:hypothetical protein